jgi:hypothetical protein
MDDRPLTQEELESFPGMLDEGRVSAAADRELMRHVEACRRGGSGAPAAKPDERLPNRATAWNFRRM